MSLQLLKAGTSDVLTLNGISKRAFDSDILVGAASPSGPPGYMSMSFHMKMARQGHLYKLTDDGSIVGGAILFLENNVLNVGRIFVAPEHFRKGYGSYDSAGGATFSLADAVAYRTAGASKAMPGFDVMDYGQEDYVFGSSSVDARHWDRHVLDVLEAHQDVLADLFN